MPRALTESAKKRRLEKEQRIIEKPSDLPDNLKQATIEFLYRTGKDAKEITEFTGISERTVYQNIKRIKENGTSAPTPRSGRPVTATSKVNIVKARKIISKNPEASRAELSQKLKISKVSFEITVLVICELHPEFRCQHCPQKAQKSILSDGPCTSFDRET
jgi:transposase-like protein